jgi:hypothetical protein
LVTQASLNKAGVGLGNADNTSDVNKPISTATQAALNTLTTSVATVQTTANTAQTAANAAQTAVNTITTNTTGILTNINSATPYFSGFPTDTPAWQSIGGASYVNNVNISTGIISQTLTFPSNATVLNFNTSNTYPNTLCTLTVSILLGTATNLVVSVSGVGLAVNSKTFSTVTSS